MASRAFELGKSICRRVAPHLTKTLKMYKTLSLDLGHYKTLKTSSCVDRAGNPLPWYTYPTIEYLRQFDFRDRVVFEFGLGNSTLFWAQRARRVVAVENDGTWFEQVSRCAPDNVSCHFAESREAYINYITTCGESFDVIVIDGFYRRACAGTAIRYLAPDGFIILDNADWCQETAAFLRSQDLIEVDMAGFSPINNYTSTTSLFLRRGVRLVPAGQVHPVPPVGSWPIEQAQADLEERILPGALVGPAMLAGEPRARGR